MQKCSSASGGLSCARAFSPRANFCAELRPTRHVDACRRFAREKRAVDARRRESSCLNRQGRRAEIKEISSDLGEQSAKINDDSAEETMRCSARFNDGVIVETSADPGVFPLFSHQQSASSYHVEFTVVILPIVSSRNFGATRTFGRDSREILLHLANALARRIFIRARV